MEDEGNSDTGRQEELHPRRHREPLVSNPEGHSTLRLSVLKNKIFPQSFRQCRWGFLLSASQSFLVGVALLL